MDLEPADDAALLKRIAQGDLAPFDRLVDRYKGPIRARIRRRIADPHRAEDVCQEVFLRLFRAARSGGFSGEGNVRVWLFTIASNCVVDALRRGQRRPEVALDFERPSLGIEPIDSAADREQLRSIENAMESLPPEQREVIEMKLMDGLSFSEIAEVLGCPITTVKSRMSYGLKKISSLIAGPKRGVI